MEAEKKLCNGAKIRLLEDSQAFGAIRKGMVATVEEVGEGYFQVRLGGLPFPLAVDNSHVKTGFLEIVE